MYNQDGFSLTELYIVIIIVAIMAAIAIPCFTKMIPQIRLNGAVRQIIEDFMWTRSQAVSKKNSFIVDIKSPIEYKIFDDKNNNNSCDPNEWNKVKNIEKEFPGVSIPYRSWNPIEFSSRGTIRNCRIVVQCGDKRKLITISIAGRIIVD